MSTAAPIAFERADMPRPTLHQRIADSLESRIKDGSLGRGSELPSEAQLMREFGVARGTIRRAVATLNDRGLVEVRQGRNTRVRRSEAAARVPSLVSFSRWGAEFSVPVGQSVISVARGRAAAAAAAWLAIEPAAPVVTLIRLRTVKRLPVMVERIVFPEATGGHLLSCDLESGSVFDYLRERGVRWDSSSHVLDAVPADQVDSEALEVPPDAPLLRVRRVSRDSAGVPIEFADERYRVDRTTLRADQHLTERAVLERQLEGDLARAGGEAEAAAGHPAPGH
ncbi:MAG: GntR family transcriptional regulator [Bifidobacteriaceae bacterium]|jgi:GntR family transcriptional regulator|nr:GntR family transcriptional regulator [Bifidobacteriaceae bacterium]